jgi:hypothetical protein
MSYPFVRTQLSRDTEYVVAELAVLRALEVAGKRARLPRSWLPERQSLPSHALHVRFVLAHTDADLDRLLFRTWDHLQLVLFEHAEQIAKACDEYVRDLITRQVAHDCEALRAWLAERLGD